MNHVIKFRHRYNKLAKAEFTTIRGKAQFKKLKVGQTVTVETLDVSFEASVTKLELKRVNEMPLAFLKDDASYPGFAVVSYRHFIDLLNSFRAPAWSQVTMESELTIIYLCKTQTH